MTTAGIISIELARALRDSGLRWKPSAGDWFVIDRVEADDETFILSDMTVEAHEYSTGTEWALDSVAIDDALWLPREDQLRVLLGTAFTSLTGRFTVTAVIDGIERAFESDAVANAYARAVLALVDAALEQ